MKRTELRRKKPVKKRNAKRQAANFARAYDEDKVAWLKFEPCAVSGMRGNIDCAHVRNGGMGRKADAKWLIPLAGELHRELHRIGRASFEAKWMVDLDTLAAQTERRWQQVVAVNAP